MFLDWIFCEIFNFYVDAPVTKLSETKRQL